MRGFHPWVGKIPLEKEMATHSNILARKIPWTEEPGGLQSMGSQSQTRLSRRARCPQARRPQISWTRRWLLLTSPLTPQKTVHKGSTPFLNNYGKTSIFPKNWTIKTWLYELTMWESDYKESWALKNWCFWTVVWEKTLESPLDCKEIQPVHPEGNQSWIFTGRTEAETPNSLTAWCEELTHWKRPWCWKRLKAEGDDRGWDPQDTML